MFKTLILSLFLTVAAFAQYEYTFTFLDSAATTGGVLIKNDYFPVSLRTGDLNKISEFEFNYGFGATTPSTWYTVTVPDSNYAVSVADNVLVPLQRDIFENLKAHDKNVWLRLNPNDSDTTSRSVVVTFDK